MARLLVQEKGEEDYEYLYSRKSQELRDKLNDQLIREEGGLTCPSKEESRQ